MIFSCLLTGVGSREPVSFGVPGAAGSEVIGNVCSRGSFPETVFMSRLLGAAALAKGFDVRGFDSADMAQWGGSVVSHIRLGQNIQSPLIPRGKADLIIALEPAEAVRVHSFLSPTGKIVVLDRAIYNRAILPEIGMKGEKKYVPGEMLAYLKEFFSHPSEERAAHKEEGEWLTVVSSEALIKTCGSSQYLAAALLGAAAEKKLFPFTAEDILAVLKENNAPESLDINIRAFNAGREFAG